jgi:hypothetical protein
MRRRFTIAALIAVSALANACAEDARHQSADQRAHQAASPAGGKEVASESAGHQTTANDRKQHGSKSKKATKTSGDRQKRQAGHEQPTAGSEPTAAQIQAARDSQGGRQLDDRSPREKRLRAIGAARQGASKKTRTLSPKEQRAFEIGTRADYQNRHWAQR